MNDRLSSLEFLAAASIDNAGRPFVAFNSNYNLKAIAWGIAHEAIHIAQICKGDWEPFEGYSVWKGQKYANLEATDPNYSSIEHQPWEWEAESLEEEVRKAMNERLPTLNDL